MPRPDAGFQSYEMRTCRTWDNPRKRLPLVREKAGFTHDMTIFHHDVRRKRFIMHERVAQRFPDRNFRQNMQQEDEAV